MRLIHDNVRYIQFALSTSEQLCQLAEEAAELAQAALKYRRTLTGDNPTPVTQTEAAEALIEEMADVLGAAEVCCIYHTKTGEADREIDRIKKEKPEHWASRLEAEREAT